jgi:hypothetical protein
VRQPTPEECEAGTTYEHAGRRGFATWYPQMGGYVGRCVVLFGASTTVDGKDGGCFDVFVWHDGEFPFGDRDPIDLHHCMAEQFIEFGRVVLAKQIGAAVARGHALGPVVLVAPSGHSPGMLADHEALADVGTVILVPHGWTQAQIDAEAVRVAVDAERERLAMIFDTWASEGEDFVSTERAADAIRAHTVLAERLAQLRRDLSDAGDRHDGAMCDTIDKQIADLEATIAEREAAPANVVSLLREIEWCGGTVDGCSCCPACGAEPERGTDPDHPKRGAHLAGCKLAALLARGAR